MTLRLFAALDIADDVADALARRQRGVPGASWRPPANFHVTLRFFGEINENLARDLDDELGQIRTPPFDIALKGAGWFGAREPYSLWAGVEPNDTLTTLAGRCERAARRVGLPPEKRAYAPHVTLAYLRHTPPEAAARFAERNADLRVGPILVDRFHLMSSWLGKGPSRYRDEAEYPLTV